jgi:hypothetical protein
MDCPIPEEAPVIKTTECFSCIRLKVKIMRENKKKIAEASA